MTNQESAPRVALRAGRLYHGDSVNYKTVYQLAVGDYLEVTVVIGGAAVVALGVVTQTRSNNRNTIQMVLRNVGPIWLRMSGTHAIIPKDAVTAFCANCFQEEHEHVGGRCMYAFSRYQSITKVY